MLPIIKFEYNNKLYCVELQNKELRYYYIKNNIKNYNLTQEEKELVDYVVDSVIPSNNVIKLMTYELNNREYNVYLDNKTNLRLFKPAPSYKDLIVLNKIFNDMEEYVAVKNKKPKGSLPYHDDTPYFKRIIKLGIDTITSIVLGSIAAGIIFSATLAPPVLYEYRDSFINYTFSEIAQTSAISNEQLLSRFSKAIESNKNLTEEEKNYILTFKDVILDNKNSTNISYVEDVLRTLSIEYHPEKHPEISGCYNPSTNCITIYEATCLADANKATVSHEILHTFTEYSHFLGYNSFLTETINTIFNEEYKNEDNNIYKKYTKYTYALMEIIGGEPLKKYHGYECLDYIIDPLCKIINGRSKAKKLLALMDDYKKVSDALSYGEVDNIAEALKNLGRLDDAIKKELGEYYQAKYGVSMYDDLVMLYYLAPESFKQEAIALGFSDYVLYEDLDNYDSTNCSYINYFNCKNGMCLLQSCISKPQNDTMIECTVVVNNSNRYLTSNNADDKELVEYNYLYNNIGYLYQFEAETLGYNETTGDFECIRALCELIGTEPVRNFYNTCNANGVINSLCQIIPDRDRATRFIKSIDEYEKICTDMNATDAPDEEYHKKYKEKEKKHDELCKEFNNYYFALKGVGIDEDLIMLRLLKRKKFFETYEGILFESNDEYVEIKNDPNLSTNIFTPTPSYLYFQSPGMYVIVDSYDKNDCYRVVYESYQLIDETNRYIMSYGLDWSNTPTR